LFGMFVVRGDGVIVADSMTAATVGSNIQVYHGWESGRTPGVEAPMGSDWLLDEMKLGEQRCFFLVLEFFLFFLKFNWVLFRVSLTL